MTSREKRETGEETCSCDTTPEVVGSGAWDKLAQTDYFEKEVDIVDKVERVVEELREIGSGIYPPAIGVLLCLGCCERKRCKQELFHLIKFKKVEAEDPRTCNGFRPDTAMLQGNPMPIPKQSLVFIKVGST